MDRSQDRARRCRRVLRPALPGARVKDFAIDTIVGDGDRCVVLGSLRTEILATGRDIETEYAIDIAVRDGLVTRYRMFEDTWAVVAAFEPKAA
ncbi:nuclear transport factor 2 family protein [Streptomyces polyrhachis]|uniref:Nuclear transport factor 2 family protein n=1 Tax=Streptomyces polyrhachis TaxID=1282885 RepID=A0ABW2GH70_9ACTN